MGGKVGRVCNWAAAAQPRARLLEPPEAEGTVLPTGSLGDTLRDLPDSVVEGGALARAVDVGANAEPLAKPRCLVPDLEASERGTVAANRPRLPATVTGSCAGERQRCPAQRGTHGEAAALGQGPGRTFVRCLLREQNAQLRGHHASRQPGISFNECFRKERCPRSATTPLELGYIRKSGAAGAHPPPHVNVYRVPR